MVRGKNWQKAAELKHRYHEAAGKAAAAAAADLLCTAASREDSKRDRWKKRPFDKMSLRTICLYYSYSRGMKMVPLERGQVDCQVRMVLYRNFALTWSSRYPIFGIFFCKEEFVLMGGVPLYLYVGKSLPPPSLESPVQKTAPVSGPGIFPGC